MATQASDDEKHAAVLRAREVGQAEAAREFGRNASTLSKWADAGYGDEGEPMGTTDTPMFDTPDGPPPDAKPKGSTGGKSKSKPKSGGGKTPPKADIEGLIATLGLGVYMVDAYDGQRVMEGAEKLADALHTLAKDNVAVRRALQAALATSTWGAVATALAPIILPIAENHGLIGSGMAAMVGAPPPPAKTGSNGSGKADVTRLFGSVQAPDFPPSDGGEGEPGPASGGTATTPDEPEDDGA